MKYIKTFENTEEIKIGDVVKIIWDKYVPLLYRDEIGEVIESNPGKFDLFAHFFSLKIVFNFL